MVIHNNVQTQEFRCPKCGNKLFPDGIKRPVTICPVIGCNAVMNPDAMKPMVVISDTVRYDPTAVTTRADGTVDPVLYDRDVNSDIIVKGLQGDMEVVTIPALVNGRAVMSVAPGAFKNNKTLRRVTLPDTVTTIGQDAFANCTNLEEITFGSGLTLLDKGCLSGCRTLDSVTLPAKVREIGNSAFRDCSGLVRLVFEGGVEVIRADAFYDCYKLRQLVFRKPADRVADTAFSGCYELPEETLTAFCCSDAQ